MAASHISGPSLILPTDSSAEMGPSVVYQGFCIPDVRQPYRNGVTGAGRIFSFPNSPYVTFIEAAPSPASPAGIAAAQPATSGTPMALASAAAAGIAPNAPILPPGASPSAVVKALALDAGFAVAATTAGSAVLTMPVAALALYPRIQPGLSLAIAAGAGSTWLFATVLSVSGTSVTVSSPMGATLAAAPVALANATKRNDETPVSITAYQTAGAAAVFDPRSGAARGVSVTSGGAGDTGWTATVRGWDVFMNPMAEAIPVTAAGVAYGKKAFKYIASVTPTRAGGGTSTGTIAVGTSDLFGLAMRSDAWEHLTVHWGGAAVPTSGGWTSADLTTPATGATGDVRGTLQLSAAGPSGTFVAGGAPDGTRRLVVSMKVPADNLLYATFANPAPLFGAAQFAG